MFLSCREMKDDDDTYFWNINFVQGRIFDTLNIVIVSISALQAERVFYTVPFQMGFFKKKDAEKDLDEIEKEIQEKQEPSEKDGTGDFGKRESEL